MKFNIKKEFMEIIAFLFLTATMLVLFAGGRLFGQYLAVGDFGRCIIDVLLTVAIVFGSLQLQAHLFKSDKPKKRTWNAKQKNVARFLFSSALASLFIMMIPSGYLEATGGMDYVDVCVIIGFVVFLSLYVATTRYAARFTVKEDSDAE